MSDVVPFAFTLQYLATIRNDVGALKKFLEKLDKTNIAEGEDLRFVAQRHLDKANTLDDLIKIEKDPQQLRIFIQRLKGQIVGSPTEKQHMLLDLAEIYLKDCEKEGSARESPRVEDIRFHVDSKSTHRACCGTVQVAHG